ncbi:MAG: toprim domain-containing protein, partial [Microcystaceae cyanobacterium]
MHESGFLRHEPCPRCGSQDNVAVYQNGHKHCHTPGCGYHVTAQGHETEILRLPATRFYKATQRGLLPSTCEKYGVFGGKSPVDNQLYYYFPANEGKTHSYKIRRAKEKHFRFLTPGMKPLLFGSHVKWGRKPEHYDGVIITEGEFDAMAAYEMFGTNYVCVSLFGGASGAAKELQRQSNWLWLNQFKTIVLCFDNDEHGRRAIDDCVKVVD